MPPFLTVASVLLPEHRDHVVHKTMIRGLKDSVFLYAKGYTEDPDTGELSLEFDSSDCLAFLSNRYKAGAAEMCAQAGLPRRWADHAPTVSQIRSGERSGLLVSSSALVSDINGKILIVERDEKAPVDPFKWQAPGGRSETTDPVAMATMELMQEISMVDKSTSRYLTPDDLKPSGHDADTKTVLIRLDGKLLHDYKCPAYLDKETHTLENLVHLKTTKPADQYRVWDNEFGRTVGFLDKADLVNGQYAMVSYLHHVLPQPQESKTMNTRIELGYRTGSDKAYTTVILPGAITQAQVEQISRGLIDSTQIIANQVHLPTPSEQLAEERNFPEADDHILTTMEDWSDGTPKAELLHTPEEPTHGMDIATLASQIEHIGTSPRGWDYLTEEARMDIPFEDDEDDYARISF